MITSSNIELLSLEHSAAKIATKAVTTDLINTPKYRICASLETDF